MLSDAIPTSTAHCRGQELVALRLHEAFPGAGRWGAPCCCETSMKWMGWGGITMNICSLLRWIGSFPHSLFGTRKDVPRKRWDFRFWRTFREPDRARMHKNSPARPRATCHHLQVTEISGLCALGSFWEMALAVDLKVRRSISTGQSYMLWPRGKPVHFFGCPFGTSCAYKPPVHGPLRWDFCARLGRGWSLLYSLQECTAGILWTCGSMAGADSMTRCWIPLLPCRWPLRFPGWIDFRFCITSDSTKNDIPRSSFLGHQKFGFSAYQVKYRDPWPKNPIRLLKGFSPLQTRRRTCL